MSKPPTAATPHIAQLREHLMATLADLRSRTNPMEPDRARAIGQVASVLIDSAKVEIEYLRVTHADRSDFLEPAATNPALPGAAAQQGAHNPFRITRHVCSDDEAAA